MLKAPADTHASMQHNTLLASAPKKQKKLLRVSFDIFTNSINKTFFFCDQFVGGVKSESRRWIFECTRDRRPTHIFGRILDGATATHGARILITNSIVPARSLAARASGQ
jgi:hypothetical protein